LFVSIYLFIYSHFSFNISFLTYKELLPCELLENDDLRKERYQKRVDH